MASDLTERRAALRTMLVDRASAEARAADRAPRSRVTEPGRLRIVLVTGVVAAVVVGASAVTLQVTGASRPIAGGPAVTATASDVPGVSASPSEPPTPIDTPTSLDTSTPLHTPTSPEPSTTAPTRALITPTGWQRITREQLHAYVSTGAQFQDDPANAAIWEAEMWRNVGCMADHGFVFDPVTWAQSRVGSPPGLTAQQAADFEVAMYGPKTDQPYDWRTAGCDGAAVHAEGQDHAN